MDKILCSNPMVFPLQYHSIMRYKNIQTCVHSHEDREGQLNHEHNDVPKMYSMYVVPTSICGHSELLFTELQRFRPLVPLAAYGLLVLLGKVILPWEGPWAARGRHVVWF